MAIGDTFAAILGTAATNRQPSSGVEENITCLIKHGTTDALQAYDGSNQQPIINTTTDTDNRQEDVSANRFQPYNMSIPITNSVYFRKNGTTDQCTITGFQFNA